MQFKMMIRSELEAYIKQHELTLSQFAQSSNVNVGTLSSFISGNRSIPLLQLDRITSAMRLPTGHFYSTYIYEYFDNNAKINWRRLEPLILRCAELDMLDHIKEILDNVMDNLSYIPMLFKTAETLFKSEHFQASKILYQNISTSERYQHSERLAICQYRLFSMNVGDNQEQNLQAAIVFECYVERLDEAMQLDALKELIHIYMSLHYWDRAKDLIKKLELLATRQLQLSKKESSSTPKYPIFVYILYSHLLQACICDEQGDYEGALKHTALYANHIWNTPNNEQEKVLIGLFAEWAIVNTYLYQIMLGNFNVLPQYLKCISQNENEIMLALLRITQAANQYNYNIDDILETYNLYISPSQNKSKVTIYNPQINKTRYYELLNQLSFYYFKNKKYSVGIDYTLASLKTSYSINSAIALQCIKTFENYKHHASTEQLESYRTIINNL